MIRTTLLLTLLLVTFRLACAEDVTPAPDSLRVGRIRELMELTGTGNMGEMILENMAASFRENGLSLRDEQWADYRAKADVEGLRASLVPVYNHYYTEEELTLLLDLYRTPLGRTVLAKSQAVMQGCVQIGQSWGDAVAAAVIDDLKAQGLLKTQKSPAEAVPPAPETKP